MTFEVIIVGGGHAGAEAAWAAARIGARTALVTFDAAAIGRMSCNPAIGGIGKGQMVREIDALGGLMGLATDRACIQFRMLNRSKGPAVQAPRGQCDSRLYERAVQELLAATPQLTIVEGAVARLLDDGAAPPRVRGIALKDGRTLHGEAVIITTGTFLRGLMHCGPRTSSGGRVGESSAETLSDELRRLGLELGRLKTGTPPRLDRASIDLDRFDRQEADAEPTPFSFMSEAIANPPVCCWIAHTNAAVHALIRDNLHQAPMYSGRIQSRGPRYCPSIEDKVVRFADKPRHQVFLEPEGYDSPRIYCNGISTSLPADVQEQLVRAIEGLESARILQHGYAVEYDFVPPHQTLPTMESKRVAGLYLAGQINGTSGYEEAAGQGIVAGINAALRLRGAEPLILSRAESYLGVMLDDLATLGVNEPYRMFTSRAEHRLSLRSDNADQRLTPAGRRVGLVDDARWRRFEQKQGLTTALTDWCRRTRHDGRSLDEWIRRPDFDRESVLPGLMPDELRAAAQRPDESAAPRWRADAWFTAVNDLRYEGYVKRQQADVRRMALADGRRLQADMDYAGVTGLRVEAREKLGSLRPLTLGQARRIPGLTPADMTVLSIHLARGASGDRHVASP